MTDILLWVKCYASLMSVLASRYPDKIGQFTAYQRTIIKAHRSFVGDGWVIYDSYYRRKAAVTKNLDWASIDFTLYNETFSGRAKALERCRHCLSEHHLSSECQYAPVANPAIRPPLPQYMARQPQQSCQLFNSRLGNRCRFHPCKYAHTCSACGGTHPASSCTRGLRPPVSKYPRAESPHPRVKK